MSFDVGDLVGYLGLDDTEFNRKLDAAQGKMGRVGDKLTGAGQKMSMGVTLPALALAAVTIDSAAKFETAMNQVQVATGSTAADLQGLSDYAKQMGADTVYSAGEAADAMLELAVKEAQRTEPILVQDGPAIRVAFTARVMSTYTAPGQKRIDRSVGPAEFQVDNVGVAIAVGRAGCAAGTKVLAEFARGKPVGVLERGHIHGY